MIKIRLADAIFEDSVRGQKGLCDSSSLNLEVYARSARRGRGRGAQSTIAMVGPRLAKIKFSTELGAHGRQGGEGER